MPWQYPFCLTSRTGFLRCRIGASVLAHSVLSATWMARVLVVDDSPLARAAASKLVGDSGFEVLTASSVEEATVLDALDLAAAVLDIEIGSGSGIDLAARLRAKRPTLPVAFLSASSDIALRGRAAELGPVFDKTQGLEGLETWVASLQRT